MIPENLLANLESWAMQVFVIASIGALLPLVFRIRHPRSQLAYCHLLLAVCLVLPVVQPWQTPIISVDNTAPSAVPVTSPPAGDIKPAGATPISWRAIVVWIIVAGFVGRVCWTAIGLWMIRRHKAAAMPLFPLPESIKEARLYTNADAVFCVSSEGIGPVTFGFFQPVVLLPASFTSLSAEAQCGIACHELLHVRRRDWLVTLIEEVIAALFWFHPAFWWLLAQARLAREQLVDAEVVRMTSAREPYVHALLAMAGARPALDVAPAPLFLRRRHLFQRMQLLVAEVSMSKLRLLSSYTAIATILAVAGWVGFVSFPLVGHAEVKAAPTAAEPASQPQNSPGYVVNIQGSYPREALEKRIEGQVVVELTFNAAGNIVDARVLSGPEELRRAGLESALRGNYSINVARSLQVVVDFRLPAGRGTLVPPPPPPPPPPPNVKGAVERIEIIGLPEQEATFVRQRVQGFQGREYSVDLATEILEAVRNAPASSVIVPILTVRRGATDNSVVVRLSYSLQPGVVQTPFGSAAVGARGLPFGAVGGPGGPPMTNNRLTPIRRVNPEYPPLAKQARIQGVVVLQLTLNRDGSVSKMQVVTGHPLLIQAAIDAVKQWLYEPQADDTTMTIATLNFATDGIVSSIEDGR